MSEYERKPDLRMYAVSFHYHYTMSHENTLQASDTSSPERGWTSTKTGSSEIVMSTMQYGDGLFGDGHLRREGISSNARSRVKSTYLRL